MERFPGANTSKKISAREKRKRKKKRKIPNFEQPLEEFIGFEAIIVANVVFRMPL